MTKENFLEDFMGFSEEMIKKAIELGNNLVLPEGTEERTIKAARIIKDKKIAKEVFLLGNEAGIRESAEKAGVDLQGLTLINPETSDMAGDFAGTYYELRKH